MAAYCTAALSMGSLTSVATSNIASCPFSLLLPQHMSHQEQHSLHMDSTACVYVNDSIKKKPIYDYLSHYSLWAGTAPTSASPQPVLGKIER